MSESNKTIKYFDRVKNRLIYTGKKATPDFWDNQWKNINNLKSELAPKNLLSVKVVKKYLRPDNGIILDGGCGIGQTVAALTLNGYSCVGLDYAADTVTLLNRHFPELDIRTGDVRNLPFTDKYFIGHWSAGIIEHYWEGYEKIISEMARVIKDGGYLFLSFPYMSPIRKIKARLGLYRIWHGEKTENFYQFALDPEPVIKDLQGMGFRLIDKLPFEAVYGTADEISAVRPLMQRLFDYKGTNIFIKALRRCLSLILSPIMGHSILLILRK
jgi:SAM-dependent methyltransferase